MLYKYPHRGVNLEEKEILFAFDYYLTENKNGHSTYSKPYKCKVINGKVYKYSKSGNILKSGVVSEDSRSFTDTKLEADIEYNKLIDNSINYFKKRIEEFYSVILIISVSLSSTSTVNTTFFLSPSSSILASISNTYLSLSKFDLTTVMSS